MNKKALSNPAALSRPAGRLLSALAGPGAMALADPTREGDVIVRGGGSGPSLGRGSHRETIAQELARNDLVVETRRPGGSTYAITEAGLACLRRAEAAGSDQDPFGAQHREVVDRTIPEEDGPARVSVNAAESPLDWLRRRKGANGEPLIDAACFEAGERLRRDLTFGAMLPSVTARWEGSLGKAAAGPRDPAGATDTVIAARQRVRKALDTVGPDFADLLIDLCGFLKGLETIERDRRWPARSGKVVARLALRRLADHYGLESEARGPARSRRLRSWAGEEAGPGPD